VYDSVRALLEGAVDYAGLFPPAGLSMERAVANFADYHAGSDRWALGRFVVPAARLDEFHAVAAPRLAEAPGAHWRLSALAGDDLAADAARVAGYNGARTADRVPCVVDAVEWKARDADAVQALGAALPPGVTGYAEVALAAAAPCAEAARAAGVRLKARTGGVTGDAFPDAHELAAFVAACVARGVPFKATAGLHHPFRGSYALTYDPGSEAAEMFGYLNVFAAAAFAARGLPVAALAQLLVEGGPGALEFSAGGAQWRGFLVSTEDLRRSRANAAISFGSCSFTEPLTDLAAHSLA
jgi:hypothetical protein